MGLNDEQKAAVTSPGGPVLVLAGPGSGKTTVITRRVLYLTRQAGVDPSQILVVTFTRAAADEMRQRFLLMEAGKGQQAGPGRRSRVSFGTFHAVFFSVLKSAYGYTADNIIREEKKFAWMKEIIKKLGLDTDNPSDLAADLLSEISSVKGSLADIDNYYSSVCAADIFRQIYRLYTGRMERENLIDFDDMVLYTRELFRERGDILAAWQRKFAYVLIDEFQDISPLQYEIVRMLAAPQNNLFVVGDDDQSIYGFRGANPRIMLGFEKDYPGAKKIILPVNYRSQACIVRGADRVIRCNKDRFAKNIRASRPAGSSIHIQAFGGIFGETEAVLDRITRLHESGMPYSQIAVLFRTNTQARPFIEKLMEYNIPFRVQDAVPNLYQHWISRDILAYLKIAAGSRERADFLRIINKPVRYISRSIFVSGKVDIGQLYDEMEDRPWMISRIDDLVHDLKVIASLKPGSAVSYIRRGIGYDAYLEEYAGSRGIDLQPLMQIADELTESAYRFDDLAGWLEDIDRYSENLKNEKRRGREEKDCVTLATMHHAKGLEYQVVIIVDANEGLTPYRKSQTPQSMEEERRMFYVAMTRAKDELYIFFLKERYGRPMKTSRFVRELASSPDARLKKGRKK